MKDVVRSVVIVGGGVSGVSTATALRSSGFDGAVTIVEASEQPYDRPPLSKGYLSGRQTLEDIALQPSGWYDDNSVRLVGGSMVQAIRPADRSIELSTGERLRTDRVVLATGGHAARPPVAGMDSPRVHSLRNREDADALRAALVADRRLLVVGGGLIGAETASTARDLGVAVTIVDAVPVPLEAAVGPELGEWLHQMHSSRGITTIRATLQGLEDCASGVRARFGRHEGTELFDAVVVGVGMRPETSLAESIGLEVDHGVVVDSGQRTRCPGVLAVGDPTRRRMNGILRPRAEHWEAAQHDGARAAATIMGLAPPEATAPWFWSDRHGIHLEGVGHMDRAATRVTRGRMGEVPFSVWGLRDDRVVAVAAVDDATSIRAGRRMIDRDLEVSAAELADPAVDLRQLLRGRR